MQQAVAEKVVHAFGIGDENAPLTAGYLTMRKDEMELLASNRAQFVFLAGADRERDYH